MDIDKIKYIIDFSKKTGIHYVLEQKDIEILEHILAEREEDKKRIEELEDENRVQRHQIMEVFDRGYIHKDKIREIMNNRKERLLRGKKSYTNKIRIKCKI